MSLPKTIYVRRDVEDGESYLIAYDNELDIVGGETTTVGVYTLTEQYKARLVPQRVSK